MPHNTSMIMKLLPYIIIRNEVDLARDLRDQEKEPIDRLF